MARSILPLLLCLAFGLSAQPIFIDYSEAAGIGHPGRNFGVAFGDYDGDGLEDIYISRHNAPNLLYKALASGQFAEVAEQAGIAYPGTTTVSTWADIDNDGDLDLYLGNRDEPNILYLNNGDGTFTDISEQAGVQSGHRTRAVLFGDVDQDGFVDLYIANMNAPNYLYHNNGNNTFTNIIEQANAQDYGIAMGALFFDYDNDGDLDLYLTHDANQPNILYRNDGTGRFEDVSAASGANIAAQGMGVDFADFNNDGFFDLYITNLYANALLLNNGDGTFSNIAQSAGVGDMGMGWGTVCFDYDNDGFADIYAANDSYFAPFPNVLYRNRGDNTFEIVSTGTPLESMKGGYGIACGDVNADGRPDLLLANAGSQDGNQLFLNQVENGNRYLSLRLQGSSSNRSAIGARVKVEAGGRQYMRELCAGSGYASQNSFRLHFGLGQAEQVERLEVRWPNGHLEIFEGLAVNSTYLITEQQGLLTPASDSPAAPALSLQVWPNPIGQALQAQVLLPEAERVHLRVFNAAGQLVAQHPPALLPAGASVLSLPSAHWAAGVYFCELMAGSRRAVVRVLR